MCASRATTVVDAGFDAAGCGALTAAGSACVDLVRGAGLLEAARVGSTDVAAELGGLSAGKLHAADLAADALARALGAAAVEQAELEARPDRVLVAMSGGVDSAVAALLSEGSVAAVTLELWRDAENDAEGSCCSASAVRSARALAHRMGIPHFTVDLRDAFRAGVVQPWLDDHAAGLTPNPCVRCNGSVRLDAMADLATRLGAAALATGHYARVTDDGLLRCAADPAKDQAYMLAGLCAADDRADALPAGRADEGPRARDRGRARPAGGVQARFAGPLLPRRHRPRARFLERHGGIGDRPGAIVDRRGNVLGRHRGAHRFTVGQRRGLEVGGAGEPLYVLGTDVDARTVTVGSRAELATSTVALRDVRPAPRRRGRRGREAALPHRRAVACTLEGDTLALAEPFAGAAPGQVAVLLHGRRDRRIWNDQLVMTTARDPRGVPGVLRGARPQAHRRRRSSPPPTTPRSCSRSRACTRSSPTSWGSMTAAQPPDELPDVLPHAGHRHRRHDHAAPHVLRDARQLLDRRLLQAGRGRVRLGAVAGGLRLQRRTTSGSRSSRATRSSASAPTRRRSRRGWRSACRASGSSLCQRKENFWQAGPTGPCGPCSELYLDRGVDLGKPRRPAGRGERALPGVLEPRLHAVQPGPGDTLTPLPAQNIDTGLGLNRMALILQGIESIFETDHFKPLIELGSSCRASATARTSRSIARCACSPTTRAR